MNFSAITNSEWTTLMGYFANQGQQVTYYNPNSGFSFSGFATTAAAEFIPGASYLRNMDVTIEEA